MDQYSRIKQISEYANEADVHFIKIQLTGRDKWAGQTIKSLGLPHGVIVAAIQRSKDIIVPRGNVVLQPGDTLVLGAASFGGDTHIELKEVVLKQQHPWNGQPIRELDISRQTIIVMVKRKGKILIPNGDLVLAAGDKVILYTQMRLSHASQIKI